MQIGSSPPDISAGLALFIASIILLWIITCGYLQFSRTGFKSVDGMAEPFFAGVPRPASFYGPLNPYGMRKISKTPILLDHPYVHDSVVTSRLPRVYPRQTTIPARPQQVVVKSGFDEAGEYFKLAVKIENKGKSQIDNVEVKIKIPDGFQLVRETEHDQVLGSIQPGGFQSAIFWLKPLRCVDGEYSGIVRYTTANGVSRVAKIPAKRLVNVCPMLTSTERADEVFTRLKSGLFDRNCSSFEFVGEPRVVLHMAEARLSGLIPVDHSEYENEEKVYLGYACYVGQTKYEDALFAAEIQVSGTPKGGILTITIYAEDKRILSGFFVDIMYDIRRHIDIIKERMCPIATCPKCGGSIDLTTVGPDRIFRCDYCGTMGKVAPWFD
ncbi:MAG: hypothetical protein K9W43_12730 [Candidatus Thorarchaeota archaeon]|nr:hypothetical protein [Candidatus Thorarchaeota archaeon]